VVLATDTSVPIDVLPEALLEANGIRLQRSEGSRWRRCHSVPDRHDYERRVIIERLEQANWSQTEAAEGLHVPLSTLTRKSAPRHQDRKKGE